MHNSCSKVPVPKQYLHVRAFSDMDGGSRGFTVFNAADNTVAYDSGNEMEHWAVRLGHWPEGRSEKKGNEPENLLYSEFDDGNKYLFVLSERSSLVFVYDAADPTDPKLLQILPCASGPEGIVAIPERNLVAVASEVDVREDKLRSSVAIYELGDMDPLYPTIISDARDDGTFIPFAALSGLASACPYGVCDSGSDEKDHMFAVEDSFFRSNRVLTIDTSSYPAVLFNEMRITDSNEEMKTCLEAVEGVNATTLINDDMTVNIDPEGISYAREGGFWVVSEGSGTVGDEEKPFEYPNMLLRLDSSAVITKCITLPSDFPDQVRYGFEGVAEDGDNVVIAIQRPWGEEEHPRIAVYNQVSEDWKYLMYPIDSVGMLLALLVGYYVNLFAMFVHIVVFVLIYTESQNGGWVGLSDIAPVGNGRFLVLERDDQAGPDAAIKMIYQIDLQSYEFENGATLEKVLVKDLLEDLKHLKGGIVEKVEGLAVSSAGEIWIINDNDGVDDNSGETLFINVGEYKDSSSGSLSVPINDIVESLDTEEANAEAKEDSASSAPALAWRASIVVAVASMVHYF
jgi:hypothetical protein